MTKLTLSEARRCAAMSAAAAVATSTALGAGTSLTAGPAAGLLVGAVTACTGFGAAVVTIRLRVTDRRD